MPIRVLITAEILRNRRTGVERYVTELVNALARRDDVRVSVLCEAREHAAGLDPSVEVRLHRPVGPRTLFYLFCRPQCLGEFDLVHLPTVVAPFYRRPPGPKLLMTFHDVIPLVMPRHQTRLIRVWFRHVLPRLMGMCEGYIAVSRSTAEDICRFYGTDPSRIRVTPLGTAWGASDLSPPGSRSDTVLAVGTLEPRKNLINVLRAARLLRDRGTWPSIRVRVAGGKGWRDAELRRELDSCGDLAEELGYVSDDRLLMLYREAGVLVYPSLYEGFGLPVLEAMSQGCPVITSNVSSLPEVGGDAAMYVDPYSVESIAGAIERVLGDAALREEMGRKGLARAAMFSWDRCAQETVAVYRRVLEGGR